MKSSVKVTIGICVKNAEESIAKVIKSVIDQDFPREHLEVIFVDDGSTDGTLAAISDQTANEEVKTAIFHQDWKGLGTTRNVVLNNAHGKYVIWVDGDMILSKDFVKKQFSFMEENPAVGVAKGKYGALVETNLVASLENAECILDDFLSKEKNEQITLGAGGCIYRLRAIKDVDGFDERIKGAGEDNDAEFRISGAGWLLCRSDAIFFELARRTWRDLWKEYFWHGSGAYYFARKDGLSAVGSLRKVFPLTAILDEVCRSFLAYELICRKGAFLLPFHWIFKRTAWLAGFVASHLRARDPNI